MSLYRRIEPIHRWFNWSWRILLLPLTCSLDSTNQCTAASKWSIGLTCVESFSLIAWHALWWVMPRSMHRCLFLDCWFNRCLLGFSSWLSNAPFNARTHYRRFIQWPIVSLTGALYFVALVQSVAAVIWILQKYSLWLGISTVNWTYQIKSMEPRNPANVNSQTC